MATEIESNGTIATANLLTANVKMIGQASGVSDYDYFKFYTSVSGITQFALSLPFLNWDPYYVNIYDNSGTLQKSYRTSSSATYSVAATSAGYSYIAVSSYSSDDYSITTSFNADNLSIAPTYILTSSESSNEGSTVTFTLATTNVASGTSVPYTLSGISAADITGGLLTGSAIVNLYGCLPGSKRNLCCVAKKSAALLYPALIAWSVWFPRLARWPRCISADKRLISKTDFLCPSNYSGLARPGLTYFTSLHFTASLPYED